MLPKWFEEARFGMFIHWGLYAALGGFWKGQEMTYIGEWIQARFRIPNEEYAKLAETFDPVKFNADEWIRTAAEAGVKYIVYTSKHHDGFAMYHSKVSSYNIYDATPFKRDPLAELAEACRKYGVRLGIYYSQNLDWHEPDGGDPGPGYPSNGGMMSWGNDWDFPDYDKKNFRRYFENKVKPQIRELLTNYGEVSVLWCDCPLDMKPEFSQELRAFVKELQPNCIINQRIGNNCQDYGGLGDNQLPIDRRKDTRESPVTLNHTWGYKKNDHAWKTPQHIVRTLASLAARNANLLLNVGPMPDGDWPEGTKNVFAGITPWIREHADAIFGSGSNPFAVDMPFGCCTVSGKNLNLFVDQDVPEIVLNGILSKVVSATVPFTQDGEVLRLDTTGLSDPLLACVTVTFDEVPQVRQDLIPQNGVLHIRPRNGEAIHGEDAAESGNTTVSADGEKEGSKHSSFGRDGSLQFWDNPADRIVWPVILPAGRYRILLETRNRATWDAHAEWFGDRKAAWQLGDLAGETELVRESGEGGSGVSCLAECELASEFRGDFMLRTAEVLSENAVHMDLIGVRFVKVAQ
ncbi:MAG: alpha-L-fucosidase [Lentisphaeria bacterium]|nr:alpha-L-fucosidase [Lentisphaeria bacterium]